MCSSDLHHEHAHDSAPEVTPADPGTGDDTTSAAYHADCGVCHGVGAPLVASPASLGAPWPTLVVYADYRAQVPHRPLDTLLRPPLPLVS